LVCHGACFGVFQPTCLSSAHRLCHFVSPTCTNLRPQQLPAFGNSISPTARNSAIEQRKTNSTHIEQLLPTVVALTRFPFQLASSRPAPWHPAAMAPMKSPTTNYSSSNYGEDIVRQANILASCYMVDAATASLKGLHYCTTGLTGAEWYS